MAEIPMERIEKASREGGETFVLSEKADPGCKKCYGTGSLGKNTTNRTLIICRCVEKNLEKEEG